MLRRLFGRPKEEPEQEHLDEDEARLDKCLVHGKDHVYEWNYQTRQVDGKEYLVQVCACGTEELVPITPENKPRPI